MTSAWRTVAMALGFTVVALVVFNAQTLWLNLRYAVAPTSFSLPAATVEAKTPPAAEAVVPSALPTSSLPKPIGITNANLNRIPRGGPTASYATAAERRGIDLAFARAQRGKLFMQVESHGELWYVDPVEARRYLMPNLVAAQAARAAEVHVAAAETSAQGPNTIVIPSLGLQVPVVYVEAKNEKAFQQGLKDGVVHYPGTANPGELGNDYIFGHSSDYWWSNGNYKTVFAVLPQIKVGADITITNAQGQAFTYRVFEAKVAAATDTQYLGQYGYKRKLLTLQTSWPIGTALKRYVVLAELVQP